MMDLVYREVMTAFGQGARPRKEDLVVRDGFDALDKEGAVRFFSGKSWADVLAHLRGLKDAPAFGGAYFHEEWAVLSPQALAYYARAYLEFLRETVGTAQEDEEFVFHFLGALYQVFHMHKGSPFSPTQTNLLRRLVERIREEAAALEAFDYFVDDIEFQAAQVLTEMDAHGGNGS